MKGQIIYFGDPMCSWCYGFAPHISMLKEAFHDTLGFRLVMGGLRPGGTETMAQLGAFLRHHWEEVNKRSGQPFSYEILQKQDYVYDTEPSCRAVVTMRHISPKHEFGYYKKVQEAFYQKGLDMNDPEAFASLAEEYKVDDQQFKQEFTSPFMIDNTKEDFMFSQKLGVQGFPTTVLEHDEKLYLLANGFMEEENLRQSIVRILEKPAEA